MNQKPIKITKPWHKKVRVLNEKMIKEKLMKKPYNNVLVKKATETLINQISEFEDVEYEKFLNVNK